MDSSTNTRVDHLWELRGLIGSGSFGVVREGISLDSDFQKTAVKVIEKKKFNEFQRHSQSRLTVHSEVLFLRKSEMKRP